MAVLVAEGKARHIGPARAENLPSSHQEGLRLKDQQTIRDRTIADFDYQWSNYGAIDGRNADDFANSQAFLDDLFGPVVDLRGIEDRTICEVGCGHGRLVRMMQRYEPRTVFAVEPAPGALQTAKQNLASFGNVQFINARGDSFETPPLDFAYSIGVLHHIPEPVPVIDNVYDHLCEGGRFVFWVYGKEGNRAYLVFYRLASLFTKSMNSKALFWLCRGLAALTYPYVWLCKFLPLPLRHYARNVYGKLGFETRALVFFDQLNPAFAKYYTEAELHQLVAATRFTRISKIVHRHGYSWTVLCERG